MIWTNCLQRLYNRCPWLTGGSMLPRSVDASPGRVVARRSWLQKWCDRCPGLLNPWLTG